MPKYTIETSAPQEAALVWCLKEQQEADKKSAPKDVAALVQALATDRIAQVVKQHDEAHGNDPVALLAGATPEDIKAVQELLTARKGK